ncbi:MAG: hypothetical protein ACRDGP_02525, partial [Actinomycetota bacterium]
WSDSYYCDQTYDQMFLEQKTILDPEERKAVIHEMQRQFYLDAPYVVLWYDQNLQAYRNDTITGYVTSPAPNGDLFGTFYSNESFVTMRPVSEGTAGPREAKGIPAWVWIGIVVGIAVIVAAVVFVRPRRREEDRA